MATTELQTMEDVQHEIAPVIQQANAMVVRSSADRDRAMDFLKALKSAHARYAGFFERTVKTTHAAWKSALADQSSMLGPLEAAEKTVKATVRTFDDAEEAQRLAEQQRLNAIATEKARLERQKIEQEAARQRAIEQEKLAKAEAIRKQAEGASDAERKRLLAQADAAKRQAAAAAAKVEIKEAEAEDIAPPVITIAAPEKRAGESTRTVWKAKLIDKAALITAAANGSDIAASMLAYDPVAGNQQAKTLKGNVVIPGIEWYTEKTLAVKGQ